MHHGLHPFALLEGRVADLAAAQLALDHFALPGLPVAAGAGHGLAVGDEAGDHLHRALPRRGLELPRVADGGAVPAAAQLHADLVLSGPQQRGHVVFLKIDALVIGGKRRGQQPLGHALTVDLRVEKAQTADLQRRALRRARQLKLLAELRRSLGLAHGPVAMGTENPFCILNHLNFLLLRQLIFPDYSIYDAKGENPLAEGRIFCRCSRPEICRVVFFPRINALFFWK